MSGVSLVRSVRFSAGHRYWRPEWSDERNRSTFGASANPHGHNYRLEVRVHGEVDPLTGFCVELPHLDRVLEELTARVDQRDLGESIEDFAPGGRIPTTEELARWFFHHLDEKLGGDVRLEAVRVEESEALAAEYAPGREAGAGGGGRHGTESGSGGNGGADR